MLERLNLPFESRDPDVDETPAPKETSVELAQRLALEKARAVFRTCPGAVVIGADQVLDFKGLALGKPGSLAAAREQLMMLSGQTVTFQSALAVVTDHDQQLRVSPCVATFRDLSPAQIDYYLSVDQPFDTAGSAKAESLGISLLASLQSDDPTAIIGLPLIALTEMLAKAGIDPLSPPV